MNSRKLILAKNKKTANSRNARKFLLKISRIFPLAKVSSVKVSSDKVYTILCLFLGYYNNTHRSHYNGPVYTSVLNITFYSLLGVNVFVVFLALSFWVITANRKKLLLSYWVKEDLRKPAEKKPGEM